MATFGWALLAIAFLVFMMIANNSWMDVWYFIQTGIGPGNRRVDTPPEGVDSLLPRPGETPFFPEPPQGNEIRETPPADAPQIDQLPRDEIQRQLDEMFGRR